MNLFEQSYLEVLKASSIHFSNNFHDIYSFIQEDSNNNWLFRAFSRTTFGLPECSKEVRVQVEYYIEASSEQIKIFIVGNFNQYVK